MRGAVQAFAHHDHGDGHGHGHTHYGVDADLVSNAEATRALLVSMAGLLATALLQLAIVFTTGSVGLLADTIHNFGDAFTSIPLWVAFRLSRRPPTERYTYGLNRSEDLAGLVIVAVIAASAVVAGYEAILRLLHPQAPSHLGVLAAAAVIGFLGNELVAQYRIRTGERMGSAALVADGHHARVDGLTSLAVLVGAAGAYLGLPILDAIVGIAITLMILGIVRHSAQAILQRLLDGIEPDTVRVIRETARSVEGVQAVHDVRARWSGHAILAELSVALADDLPVHAAHSVANEVEHALIHAVPHLREATVHIDPASEAGHHHHPHAARLPAEG